MRIALLSFDGGEYSVRLSSALVQHAQADVKLIISEENGKPHLQALDQSVDLVMYPRPRMRSIVGSLRFVGRIWREVTSFSPDVVHIQHHQLWLYLLLLPRLRRRYPVVITVHDPVHHVGDKESQRTPQRVIHKGYRRADELIVHAKRSRVEMVDRLGLDGARVHVIPHIAVNNSGDTTVDVEEDEKLLLFFGRIWEYKGLEYLIKAEPFISKRVPDVRIMIAGRGEDFDRYRLMMKNPDRFIVHNEQIPWEVAATYFARCSIVVLPYVDASSSGVIPVAYAFGKPVVATDVGGLAEMVEDGASGYLVPPRDPRAIAEAVVELIGDRERRRRMGDRGRQKMIDECGPEVVARKTMRVYEAALSTRTNPETGG